MQVISVESVFRWWADGVKGSYHPFLVSCELPLQNGSYFLPESVSLVVDKCDVATNDVRVVHYVPEKQKEFGICFKWVDFPTIDMSRRIVEMLELLKILGVGGAHFPYLWATPETDAVLDYYKSTGFITLKPITLPGFQPQQPLSGHAYLMVHTYLNFSLHCMNFDCTKFEF